jgi:hypothetical protein
LPGWASLQLATSDYVTASPPGSLQAPFYSIHPEVNCGANGLIRADRHLKLPIALRNMVVAFFAPCNSLKRKPRHHLWHPGAGLKPPPARPTAVRLKNPTGVCGFREVRRNQMKWLCRREGVKVRLFLVDKSQIPNNFKLVASYKTRKLK